MIFEILNDSGAVVNTIVADLEFVQANYPGRYREVPQPPPVDSRPPVVTRIAFASRLTDAEYVAIIGAAKSDVAVEAWLAKFNMVSQINLADPRTVAGVDLLVSKSLLTQARATAVLTDPVQEGERP